MKVPEFYRLAIVNECYLLELDLLLYRDWYPREQRAEPIELDEHLPHERADGGGAAAAGARVHLLLVVEVVRVPVKQVCWWLCVANIHKPCKILLTK